MYAGRKVEEGSSASVFAHPAHPYTQGLLRTAAFADGPDGRMPEISGTVPSPFEMPSGCRFAPRCTHARDICRAAQPQLIPAGAGHEAACVLLGEIVQ